MSGAGDGKGSDGEVESSAGVASVVFATALCGAEAARVWRQRKSSHAQLRELKRDGVVIRTSTATVPPQVTYKLSSAGEELIAVMQAMCGWGATHLGVKPNLPRKFSRVAISTAEPSWPVR